jgi:hypothetical protein
MRYHKLQKICGGNEIVDVRGAGEVLDRMEAWTDGNRDQKSRLVGTSDDYRGDAIPRNSCVSDILKRVMKAGGDVGILYRDGSEVAGFVSNSFGSGQAAAYRSGNMVRAYGTGFRPSWCFVRNQLYFT